MSITISGSGTITGISSGGLNDGIITQAELASGVSGTGPAFSAYLSADQTVSSQVFTKVLLNVESFDTNLNFASSRFTPTVAGYYQINASARVEPAADMLIAVYKNGSVWSRGNYATSNAFNAVASTLVYCNGSTDYIEMYIFTTGTTVSGIASETMMSGFLARSAT